MIRTLTLLLAFSLVLTSAFPQTTPRTVSVARGTTLKFSTARPISSATAKVGDDVLLYLARPLVVGGESVLPAGYVAHAHVAAASPARPNCKYPDLRLEIEHLDLPDSKLAIVRVLDVSSKPDYEFRPPPNPQQPRSKKAQRLRNILTAPLVIASLPVVFVGQAVALRGVEGNCKSTPKEEVLPAKSTVIVGFAADQDVVVGP
jgi:hypothetical protein